MAPGHMSKREFQQRKCVAGSSNRGKQGSLPLPEEVPAQPRVFDHIGAKDDSYLRLDRFKRRRAPLRAEQVRSRDEKGPSKQEVEAEKRRERRQRKSAREALEEREVESILATKESLTPADVILRAIRGDPSIDSSTFSVSYMDRFLGMMVVPFDEFDAGEIPCHRIWRFSRQVPSADADADGDVEVVWDRQERINRISQCTAASE